MMELSPEASPKDVDADDGGAIEIDDVYVDPRSRI